MHACAATQKQKNEVLLLGDNLLLFWLRATWELITLFRLEPQRNIESPFSFFTIYKKNVSIYSLFSHKIKKRTFEERKGFFKDLPV